MPLMSPACSDLDMAQQHMLHSSNCTHALFTLTRAGRLPHKVAGQESWKPATPLSEVPHGQRIRCLMSIVPGIEPGAVLGVASHSLAAYFYCAATE